MGSPTPGLENLLQIYFTYSSAGRQPHRVERAACKGGAMTTAVRDLVADYIQSVGDGRLDHVAALLHPELDFGGTTAVELQGAGAYLAALERLSPIIERNDIREIVVDGDRAVVVYDFVTDTEVG